MNKIKDFINYFMKKNSEGRIELTSAYLAYYMLLSFIPLLLFSSQVIIYFIPNFSEIMFNLTRQLPSDVENIFNSIIEKILNSQSSSLSVLAVFSSLLAGSKGFLGLKKALNQIFEVETSSKIPFFDIIFSVIYTIGFIIFLTLLLLFSVFNERILSLIRQFTQDFNIINSISNIFLNSISFLTPFILAILIFIFFYKYAPSFNKHNRISFLEAFIGAFIATIGIAGITFFYKFTNDILTNSGNIYGSLGSIMLTLVWLMSICQMIIFGAIFIKSYIEIIKKNF